MKTGCIPRKRPRHWWIGFPRSREHFRIFRSAHGGCTIRIGSASAMRSCVIPRETTIFSAGWTSATSCSPVSRISDVDEPEEQRFCLCCLHLRELNFDTKVQDTLPQIMERALDTFLQERSDSYFLDDAVFSSARKLLDDIEEQLGRLLRTPPPV